MIKKMMKTRNAPIPYMPIFHSIVSLNISV